MKLYQLYIYISINCLYFLEQESVKTIETIKMEVKVEVSRASGCVCVRGRRGKQQGGETISPTSLSLQEKSFFFFPGAQFSGRPAASEHTGMS